MFSQRSILGATLMRQPLVGVIGVLIQSFATPNCRAGFRSSSPGRFLPVSRDIPPTRIVAWPSRSSHGLYVLIHINEASTDRGLRGLHGESAPLAPIKPAQRVREGVSFSTASPAFLPNRSTPAYPKELRGLPIVGKSVKLLLQRVEGSQRCW